MKRWTILTDRDFPVNLSFKWGEQVSPCFFDSEGSAQTTLKTLVGVTGCAKYRVVKVDVSVSYDKEIVTTEKVTVW